MSKRCRLCGTTEALTKHHLLKRGSARIVGKNMQVPLCRPCHDRFHGGPPASRRAAWDELYAVLTDEERELRDHPKRLLELWEQREHEA